MLTHAQSVCTRPFSPLPLKGPCMVLKCVAILQLIATINDSLLINGSAFNLFCNGADVVDSNSEDPPIQCIDVDIEGRGGGGEGVFVANLATKVHVANLKQSVDIERLKVLPTLSFLAYILVVTDDCRVESRRESGRQQITDTDTSSAVAMARQHFDLQIITCTTR